VIRSLWCAFSSVIYGSSCFSLARILFKRSTEVSCTYNFLNAAFRYKSKVWIRGVFRPRQTRQLPRVVFEGAASKLSKLLIK